jgi:hypothetical protein
MATPRGSASWTSALAGDHPLDQPTALIDGQHTNALAADPAQASVHLVAAELDDCLQRGDDDLVAIGGADEQAAGGGESALTGGGLLALAHQAGHAADDQREERHRRPDEDDGIPVVVGDGACELEHRRDQRRAGQQDEAHAGEARLAAGLHVGKLDHRGVQRRRAPQEVEEDPAGVQPQLVVVGAVQGEDPVDEVGEQQRDDAGDEQVEARTPLARVDGETDRRGQEDEITGGVGDRHQLGDQAHRAVVDVRGDEEQERDQAQPDAHDHRVDDPGAVGALVAAAHQQHQADHQHRVHADVHGVAGRRERDRGAGQLGVAVGVDVAQEEEGQTGGHEPPGGRGLGLVDADARDDADDAVEPQPVDDRARALEGGLEHVQRAEDRASREIDPPAVARPLGHPVRCRGTHRETTTRPVNPEA